MKQKILPLLCVCLMTALLLAPCVHAITPLEPDAGCSLTLTYQKEGVAFPDLHISLYRVAQAFPDGTFGLIAPYSGYPVNIHGITDQAQWKHAAATLSAYLAADGVTPDREVYTDAEGIACLEGLQTGLYLVREVLAENEKGQYFFDQFLIYLPTMQADGTYCYDMEARPKCVDFIPKSQYTVTKLWRDNGNTQARPSQVRIDICKDGVLQQTQVLSAANNWSYTWQVLDKEPGLWTVVERDVPQGYQVTVQQSGNAFSVINTRQAQPSTPETGDTFHPLPWVLTMCISGILILALGIYLRRKA